MGAVSMNLPTVFMPAGPMLRGDFRGGPLGSGSDVWKYWAELRAGTITEGDWQEIESGIARSPGHCMTMGTASTMTSAAEALGMTLAGAASIPAPDSRHAQMATNTGKRIVDGLGDLKPSDLPRQRRTTTRSHGPRASGSTNAAVHLIAMARRSGIPLTLDRFDALRAARRCSPTSGRRQVPDGRFQYAGGLRALMNNPAT
jgi:dihydroxy-acid dehydratase